MSFSSHDVSNERREVPLFDREFEDLLKTDPELKSARKNTKLNSNDEEEDVVIGAFPKKKKHAPPRIQVSNTIENEIKEKQQLKSPVSAQSESAQIQKGQNLSFSNNFQKPIITSIITNVHEDEEKSPRQKQTTEQVTIPPKATWTSTNRQNLAAEKKNEKMAQEEEEQKYIMSPKQEPEVSQKHKEKKNPYKESPSKEKQWSSGEIKPHNAGADDAKDNEPHKKARRKSNEIEILDVEENTMINKRKKGNDKQTKDNSAENVEQPKINQDENSPKRKTKPKQKKDVDLEEEPEMKEEGQSKIKAKLTQKIKEGAEDEMKEIEAQQSKKPKQKKSEIPENLEEKPEILEEVPKMKPRLKQSKPMPQDSFEEMSEMKEEVQQIKNQNQKKQKSQESFMEINEEEPLPIKKPKQKKQEIPDIFDEPPERQEEVPKIKPKPKQGKQIANENFEEQLEMKGEEEAQPIKKPKQKPKKQEVIEIFVEKPEMKEEETEILQNKKPQPKQKTKIPVEKEEEDLSAKEEFKDQFNEDEIPHKPINPSFKRGNSKEVLMEKNEKPLETKTDKKPDDNKEDKLPIPIITKHKPSVPKEETEEEGDSIFSPSLPKNTFEKSPRRIKVGIPLNNLANKSNEMLVESLNDISLLPKPKKKLDIKVIEEKPKEENTNPKNKGELVVLVQERIQKLVDVARPVFPSASNNTFVVSALAARGARAEEISILEERIKVCEEQRHKLESQAGHRPPVNKDIIKLNKEIANAHKLIERYQRPLPEPISPRQGEIVDSKALHPISMQAKITKEKQIIATTESQVKELQQKLADLDKRISLMTQKKSSYIVSSDKGEKKKRKGKKNQAIKAEDDEHDDEVEE